MAERVSYDISGAESIDRDSILRRLRVEGGRNAEFFRCVAWTADSALVREVAREEYTRLTMLESQESS